MTPPPPPDRQQKRQSLRRHGTLNPHPEAVSHPLFHNSDFFDSDDLMQVKYEMLRQVHIDKGSISESAQAFGFSRPSFYQAQAALQQDGVFGLLPHRRGPQGGHKLTTEVMEFVAEQRSADSSLTPEQLAEAIQRRFRIQVHPRAFSSGCCGKKNDVETILRWRQFRGAAFLLRGSPCSGAGRQPWTRIRPIPASRNVRVAGSLLLVYRGRCCHTTCRGDRYP